MDVCVEEFFCFLFTGFGVVTRKGVIAHIMQDLDGTSSLKQSEWIGWMHTIMNEDCNLLMFTDVTHLLEISLQIFVVFLILGEPIQMQNYLSIKLARALRPGSPGQDSRPGPPG